MKIRAIQNTFKALRATCLGMMTLFAPGVSPACELIVDSLNLLTTGSGRYETMSGGGSARVTMVIHREDGRTPTLSVSSPSSGGVVLSDADEEAASDLQPCFGALRLEANDELEVIFTDRGNGLNARGNTMVATLGNFSPGETQRYSFNLLLPEGQFLRPGSRSMEVLATLGAAFTPTKAVSMATAGTTTERHRVSELIHVAELYRLDIVGEIGHSRTVQLGTLFEHATRRAPLSLQVVANDGYTLRFTSENGGKLKNQRLDSDDTIDYRLFANGRLIALENDRQAVISGSSTTGSGKRIPLIFEAESSFRKRAGRYHDTLRVEILPSLAAS